MKLTPLQEVTLIMLKVKNDWMKPGELAKWIAKTYAYRHIRAGALGGPLSSLRDKGLVERKEIKNPNARRLPNGHIIFPTFFVYKVTEAGLKTDIRPDQGTLDL